MPMVVKKRKSTVDPLPCSPMKIVSKDSKYEGGKYVEAARSKLLNSLRGLSDFKSESAIKDEVNSYNSELGEPNQDYHQKAQCEPSILKRKKKGSKNDDSRQAFVMKLFDRSVDLAIFDENTPLYPICRAWMRNLPKKAHGDFKQSMKEETENSHNSSKMEVDDDAEVSFDVEGTVKALCRNEDVVLHKLPLPVPIKDHNNRVPAPMTCEPADLDSIINSNQDPESLPSKETLLQEHRTKWVSVRKKWHETERKNEDRYKDSRDILEAIYSKAQKNFQ